MMDHVILTSDGRCIEKVGLRWDPLFQEGLMGALCPIPGRGLARPAPSGTLECHSAGSLMLTLQPLGGTLPLELPQEARRVFSAG